MKIDKAPVFKAYSLVRSEHHQRYHPVAFEELGVNGQSLESLFGAVEDTEQFSAWVGTALTCFKNEREASAGRDDAALVVRATLYGQETIRDMVSEVNRQISVQGGEPLIFRALEKSPLPARER